MNTTEELLDEVQELTWMMIDDQATDDDVERLERLLLENDEARKVYVNCIQMHVDLQYLLGGKRFTLPKLPPRPIGQKDAVEQIDCIEQRKSVEQRKPIRMQAPARAPLPLVDIRPICVDVPIVSGFLP
jgi:hypothetical protein